MSGLNHYSELLNYIYKLADADEYVNQITQGDNDVLDLDKGIDRILVHIDIQSSGFTNGSTVKFNVSISSVGDLLTYNDEDIEPFFGNTNEVDTYNETHNVLNRLWAKMYTDFEKKEIKASENPPVEKILNATMELIGWEVTFDVEMPNKALNLCDCCG